MDWFSSDMYLTFRPTVHVQQAIIIGLPTIAYSNTAYWNIVILLNHWGHGGGAYAIVPPAQH